MCPTWLFPYWCRYLGWGLVIVHIPLTMIGKANGMVNIMDWEPTSEPVFSGEHLYFIFTTLLVVAGLFVVAFAREAVEDEQLWQLRLDSLRWSIFINYIILITSLVFLNDTRHILELDLIIPLLFFIIRFRWVIFRLNQTISPEDRI